MRGSTALTALVVVASLALGAAACGGESTTRRSVGSDGPDLRISVTRRHDPESALEVADAIVDKLDEGGDNEGELLAAATPGERADSIVESVEGEVNNGRFSQFFTNSSGSLTRQAIATAALVGAQEPERVLRAAARVFPGGQVPVDRARRNEVFERLPDSAAAVLERLDVRWYALDRGPDRRLRASIDAHPDQFFRS